MALIIKSERAEKLVRKVSSLTGEAAIADALKLAVPLRGGHPDFELNVGIARGSNGAGYTAECGRDTDSGRTGRSERAGGDGLRHRDGGIGRRKRFETFASRGARGGAAKQQRQQAVVHGGEYIPRRRQDRQRYRKSTTATA